MHMLVLKVAQAAFAVVCQMSLSTQLVFKWRHLPWTSRQPAVTHTRLASDCGYDLAALYDTWS